MNTTAAKIRTASCLSGAAVLLLGALPLATPARAAVRSDFNGDGKADVLWRHADSGDNSLWKISGLQQAGTVGLPPMPDTD